MFVPNREELACAAGFFNGEGYVGVTSKDDFITLSISQNLYTESERIWNYSDPLIQFHEATGKLGKFSLPRETEHGTVIQKYYVTRFSDVQAVIVMLWPWLSEYKKEQAKLALLRNRPKKQRQRYAVCGTRSKYVRGCRCQRCRVANATYSRDHYAKN